jgi:hypothetical protein
MNMAAGQPPCGFLVSTQDKLDRHAEPHSHGLIPAPCRFKPPLPDGLRGGLIEVRMAGGTLDADLAYSAVLQDLEEQGCGAGNPLAPGGIGVSG